MSGRNVTGEGTVYRRTDGRWTGSVFVTTTAGTRKRIYVYGETRADARTKLNERIHAEQRGLPSPTHRLTVGEYFDSYMTSIAETKLRRTTYVRYSYIAQKYILPKLANADLQRLSVTQVQGMLNEHLKAGISVRSVHHARALLRTVLSQAEREERVPRNVAKLVQLPSYHRKPIEPWSLAETQTFLQAAQGHPWYGAYFMLVTYGMRRGEVLGLTWDKVDLPRRQFMVAAQLQRIDAKLELVPVKTNAGNRSLPIIGHLGEVLAALQGSPDHNPSGFVFTSANKTPIDPKNFVRTFHQLRDEAGVRRITVHHTRHTAATALKNLGVPARDAQTILGHANVTTTQQIYQHTDAETQRLALEGVERQLVAGPVAVKAAVIDVEPIGQSTNIRALTSGTPGKIRTCDTWFRSLLGALEVDTLTSVSRHLRTRSNALECGAVAVRSCCHDSPARTAVIDRAMLREIQAERVRRATSFLTFKSDRR